MCPPQVQQGLGRQAIAAEAFLRKTRDSFRGFPSRASIQKLTLRFDLSDAETYVELPSLLPTILKECGQRLRSVQRLTLCSDVVSRSYCVVTVPASLGWQFARGLTSSTARITPPVSSLW